MFVSGFLAWKDEHEEVSKKQEEIARLRQEQRPNPTPAQIARVVGQLTRREPVAELVDGSVIVLQRPPVPETVHLWINTGLGTFPLRVVDEKDCRVEGRKITLSEELRLQVQRFLTEGGVSVEYIEQPE